MNRNYLKDFLRLFFPSYCYGCRGPMIRFEEVLCTICLRQAPWKRYRGNTDTCCRLVTGPPFEHSFSLMDFRKGGLAQRLLHELKYNHHQEIGLRLGRMLGMEMVNNGFQGKYDIIIPVPLHQSRQRVRGFNQSTVIAQGISEMIGAPVDESLVIRKKKTATQTKKDRYARWANMDDVFQVINPQKVGGRHVLLTDDVITTGATMAAFGSRIYHCRPASLSMASIADVD